MTMPTWIQELGTFGSLAAAVGVGAIVAARIARASVISGFRQKWIDDLRQDIAEAVALSGEINVAFNTNVLDRQKKDDPDKHLDMTFRFVLLLSRIRLRLNVTESDHVQLLSSLEALLSKDKRTAEQMQLVFDTAHGAARRVLKHEWDVTKYGYWMRPILRFKRTEWARKLLMTDLAPGIAK